MRRFRTCPGDDGHVHEVLPSGEVSTAGWPLNTHTFARARCVDWTPEGVVTALAGMPPHRHVIEGFDDE